jgi:hypothetical protein
VVLNVNSRIVEAMLFWFIFQQKGFGNNMVEQKTIESYNGSIQYVEETENVISCKMFVVIMM